MPTWEFTVWGEPYGQPRATPWVRQPRRLGGRAWAEMVEDNPKIIAWKKRVQAAAVSYGLPPLPLAEGCRVALGFFFPRPKRLLTKNSWPGPVPYLDVPDCDNLEKGVLDALVKIEFFKDDRFIYRLGSEKNYVEIGGEPRCEIRISTEATT